MKLKLYTKQNHCVILSQNDFIAKGGQASVYLKDNWAYKIYHHADQMIPEAKIDELKAIRSDAVMKPLEAVYLQNNQAVGYKMQ